jgi:hypothetical protein
MKFINVISEGGAGTAAHAEFWTTSTKYSHQSNESIMVEFNGRRMNIVQFFKLRGTDKDTDEVFSAIKRNDDFKKFAAENPDLKANKDKLLLTFISQAFASNGGRWDVAVRAGMTTYDDVEIEHFKNREQHKTVERKTCQCAHCRELRDRKRS